MKRWFHLTLAYDGTRYGGWQIQPNATTVQQKLEEALAGAIGHRVKTIGSGRTDVGVHAEAQVASFSLDSWRPSAECLIPTLNRRLPSDIVVRACRDVRPGFHAIREAVSKRYRYTIRNSRIADPFYDRYHWLFHRPLDCEAMRLAASHFIGEIDFASYQAKGAPRKSTIRHVKDITIASQPANDGMEVRIEIESNGFLYNMVRKIVGSLVRVGVQSESPEWILEALAMKNRERTGQTAPARGLCLIRVDYPESCFIDSLESEWQSQALLMDSNPDESNPDDEGDEVDD